jgi:hypothetical protein
MNCLYGHELHLSIYQSAATWLLSLKNVEVQTACWASIFKNTILHMIMEKGKSTPMLMRSLENSIQRHGITARKINAS